MLYGDYISIKPGGGGESKTEKDGEGDSIT